MSQKALLIQLFNEVQTAAYLDMGSISQMINRQQFYDKFQKELLQSSIAKKQLPKNAKIIYPQFHVIIADEQSISNLYNHFQAHEPNHELYKVVQNLELIHNY